MDFRSFFKPAGTNPEIEGPFYELSSWAVIVGHSNFEALTLSFEPNKNADGTIFRPVDPTKPIVLAVDNQSKFGFVVIDRHLQDGAEAGMQNYSMHKTDDFIIDCNRGGYGGSGKKFWSVTSEGITFVYGNTHFPDTWQLRDVNLLCAFVAGELTANQLRMHAYLSNREAVKEERREAHIQRLKQDIRDAIAIGKTAVLQAKTDVEAAEGRYDRLVSKLKSTMEGTFPFTSKAKVLQAIKDNN